MLASSSIASAQTLQAATNHLAGVDPTMAKLVAAHGLPTITPSQNYYQQLVESIISQQLSVKAAAAIVKRFLDLFGGTFPSPSDIIAVDIETYRSAGLSRQKASYITDLATKVISGEVAFDHLSSLSNDEIITELTAVKGIGVWTVHMFLLFCMGRLDVLPIGDLGIQNGVAALYGLSNRATPEDIVRIAEEHNWAPYESVAAWYVWRSLDNMPA